MFRIFNFYFHRIDLRIRLSQRFVSNSYDCMNWFDTIKTHCFSYAHANRSPHQRLRVNHFLYFFHIFKELLIGKSQYRSRNGLNIGSRVFFQGIWWRLTGSNRRPPACKAGALPAELNPPSETLRIADFRLRNKIHSSIRIPQSQFRIHTGGSGWTRTNDPCVINTML